MVGRAGTCGLLGHGETIRWPCPFPLSALLPPRVLLIWLSHCWVSPAPGSWSPNPDISWPHPILVFCPSDPSLLRIGVSSLVIWVSLPVYAMGSSHSCLNLWLGTFPIFFFSPEWRMNLSPRIKIWKLSVCLFVCFFFFFEAGHEDDWTPDEIILFLLPSSCWDHRHEQPCLASYLSYHVVYLFNLKV